VPFIHDGFHATLGYDSRLAHLLQGKVFALFFAFHAPYFAKTTLANAEMVNKIGFAHS